MGRVIVIDQNGNQYQTQFLNRDNVLETALTKFCEDVTYFGNSFERATLKSNQARTKFILDERSSNRLWSFYKKNNHYYDAIQRGFSYKGKFIKMLNIDTSQLPYKVRFLGEVEIYEGSVLSKKLQFIAEGKITERAAQYPESYFGWYMTDYLQNFKSND
tara:strand:- start:93 stop:572 length:480 start_codon:yes stop_codon:yes gene_type:complete